ncbi:MULTISPECIES: hypothetical protein [Fischerella]|uniref:hypothetical protein n=1 Tax=Fischerella TaxID=1190 RepID=UPI0002DF7EB0|nr:MULTISPECIES: hypothetical protein [Fischerella]
MTKTKVIFGNAAIEGANRWGWFIGHFITPSHDPRSTEALVYVLSSPGCGRASLRRSYANARGGFALLYHH